MIYDVLSSFVPSISLPESIETPIYYVAYILLGVPSIAHRRSQYLKRPSVRRELPDVYRYIRALIAIGCIA